MYPSKISFKNDRYKKRARPLLQILEQYNLPSMFVSDDKFFENGAIFDIPSMCTQDIDTHPPYMYLYKIVWVTISFIIVYGKRLSGDYFLKQVNSSEIGNW